MNRFLATIIFIIGLSPFVSQASNLEPQVIIDKIIQDQTQWKKSVAATRASADSLISAKIVGGSTAPRGRHPEFALLLFTNTLGDIIDYCGGTLISSNKILTAAHCTTNYPTNRTFVIPNFYSFNDELAETDVFRVLRTNIHPNYSSNSFDYDVSVLTLTRSSNTATVKLFEGKNQLENDQATIVGVGTLSEGGSAPANLTAASVPIVSNPICRSSYGAVITDRMLCAGLAGGGRDSCQGDSGGPLWVNIEGRKVQAGITSFGQGCARPNFYGVYSRISSLNAFILSNAPNAEFIAETKTSIIPVLQLLLLSDDEVAPVCTHSIDFENTTDVVFDPFCYNFTNSRFYKNFTFTIEQDSQVSIYAQSSDYYYGDLRLFSGLQAAGAVLNSDYVFSNQASMVDNLSAGTYTIEVTSENLDGLIDLHLMFNNCRTLPISQNSTVQASFTTDCRSITSNDNPYASYYTFTLNQTQQLTLSAPESNDYNAYVRLFSGTDVSGTALDRDSTYVGEVVLVNELTAGTYTIEITSSNVDSLAELNLSQNSCQLSPISIPSSVQGSFSTNCRSASHYTHPHQLYYTFTLNQAQQISMVASSSTDDGENLLIYSGTDVSVRALDEDHFLNKQAALVKELDAGTYTIEITSSNVDNMIDLNLSINNCQPSPISLNTTVQSDFISDCRSIGDATTSYAHYYTFTLNQAQQIIVTSPETTDIDAYVQLFSGTNVSDTAFSTTDTYFDEAVLLNELNAGTYTIEVTSAEVDSLVELNLLVNQCDTLPISVNTTVQSSFSNQCRSIKDYGETYARYYTFNLDQASLITISSPASTNFLDYVRLFSGSDVSARAIDTDSRYFSEAVLENQLSAGTYTIEVTSSQIDVTPSLTIRSGI